MSTHIIALNYCVKFYNKSSCVDIELSQIDLSCSSQTRRSGGSRKLKILYLLLTNLGSQTFKQQQHESLDYWDRIWRYFFVLMDVCRVYFNQIETLITPH